MISFLVLIALAATIFLLWKGTVRVIRTDGYGYRPPPRSHADEQERPGRLAPLGW